MSTTVGADVERGPGDLGNRGVRTAPLRRHRSPRGPIKEPTHEDDYRTVPD